MNTNINQIKNQCQQVEYRKFTARRQNKCYQYEYMESLSELVRRRINELGINNAELARRAKKSRGYIGNIINQTAPTKTGQYRLMPDTVEDLAKALEVPEADIVNAIGYETEEVVVTKPKNVAEFYERLNEMGFGMKLEGGKQSLEGLGEDDLQDLLDSVQIATQMKINKKAKAK